MSSNEKVAKKTFSLVGLWVINFRRLIVYVWFEFLQKVVVERFLGSLAKLGNCYNWTIGTKLSLGLDVIWTRNHLIWSQTRYQYATKSGNSPLHNRDLWIFVLILSARCHFGPIKTLSRNNQFHWKPSDWLSWCAFASEKQIKAQFFSAIFLAKS